MTRVLGIDASLTSTGLCLVTFDNRFAPLIQCSTITSKPVGQTFADKAVRIRDIVEKIRVRLAGIDLVVLEGPSFGSTGSAVYTLGWLWGSVFDQCYLDNGIDVIVVSPSQRAKYATGKGNAGKDAVLASVVRRWPNVPADGNDQADALVMAAIGCRQLGFPIDQMPKEHWQAVMDKVAVA